MRHACPAPYVAGASARSQRRDLPLRVLWPDPVYFGARSCSGLCFRLGARRFFRRQPFLMPRLPKSTRAAGDVLFEDSLEEQKTTPAHQANIDGAARGNPGPASYGVIIRDGGGELVAKLKKYIGRMTNNVAEYYGLIAALDYAESHGIRSLRVESDSELMVKQMQGQYKVKS